MPTQMGRIWQLNFFLANQNATGYNRDQCCHLEPHRLSLPSFYSHFNSFQVFISNLLWPSLMEVPFSSFSSFSSTSRGKDLPHFYIFWPVVLISSNIKRNKWQVLGSALIPAQTEVIEVFSNELFAK